MLKKRVVIPSIVVLAILSMGFACAVSTHDAADAVNKYANSLQAFHDSESKLHTTAKADGTPIIGDATHFKILQAEQLAVKAGHDLDAAIAVADKGGDIAQYVTVAQTSLDELIGIVKTDPVASQQLQLVVDSASAALKNAISIIEALRNKSPAPSANWLLASFMLVGLVTGAGAAGGAGLTASSIVTLLQLIIGMEPIAFDLILKFATSLKGKTTAEILALNEGIFNDLDAVIAAELAARPK